MDYDNLVSVFKEINATTDIFLHWDYKWCAVYPTVTYKLSAADVSFLLVFDRSSSVFNTFYYIRVGEKPCFERERNKQRIFFHKKQSLVFYCFFSFSCQSKVESLISMSTNHSAFNSEENYDVASFLNPQFCSKRTVRPNEEFSM